ncbi:MAG: hypothetical protein ABIE14_04460 [Patescibacteria group bacterium]
MNSPIFWIAFVAVVSAIFFAILISRRKRKLSSGEEAFIRNQWRMIGKGQNPKNDIIEADKLLDFALKKYGYSGSLGEKLKKAGKLFSDENGVWVAHKMRNKVAHEINFQFSEFEFRSALESFRKALLDLKIKL